jgi:hypothetical protein
MVEPAETVPADEALPDETLPDETLPDDEDHERFQLSAAQVAASSLAAMSAAVVCSYFGVAGTVIGTAVTSLIATTGSALYSYSLRRTRARLRRLHLAGAASPPFREVVKTARQQGRKIFEQVPWAIAGIGTGLVFVLSLDVITTIEGGIGESISAALGVSHSGGRTTSLGSIFHGGHHRHHKPKSKPSKTPTPSTTPTSTATPSHSPTVTPSVTPTKTPTSKPTLTLPPILGGPSTTPTPTPTPTATAS